MTSSAVRADSTVRYGTVLTFQSQDRTVSGPSLPYEAIIERYRDCDRPYTVPHQSALCGLLFYLLSAICAHVISIRNRRC